MFWECHVVTSSIDKLLDQNDDQLRLQDFLDENDLIQECLNQNQRLLDYLVRPTVMNELIQQVIHVPNDGNFRYANVVCELLTGDFQRIQQSLLEKEHFDELYSFLTNDESTTTLNPILVSYFARILITLIGRRTSDVLNYLKTRQTFVEDFLRHLDSTCIADILFRFVVDAGEQRSQMIQWYDEINLIDELMREFRQTNSKSIQMNIGNLFNEFLRFAFDCSTSMENDLSGPSLTTTIERLLFNRNDSNSTESTTTTTTNKNDENDGKLTPIYLVERILSTSNLEKFLDALTQRSILVENGCDFLENLFDFLSRHMPVPVCLPFDQLNDERERMQINDETDPTSINKMTENAKALAHLAKDPLVRIYINLLKIIPSRLPALITLLSSPSIRIHSTPIQYQFINEPLGPLRLNLIKFFSKLIYAISNDVTGDKIYEILREQHFFSILIDLFQHYIYNNFLHTQVYSIIRLMIHINSIAAKQSNDVWSRTALNENETFHYKNRCSYRLFQSILDPQDVNLFARLFDQYERQLSRKTSTDDQIPFQPPNSGHLTQILRCLRDHAAIFDNYSSIFSTIDPDEKRWQTILESLNDDEKKWSVMHLHERHNTNTFSLNLVANSHGIESNEARERRLNFHTRSFGSSAAPYVDDDDDDEVEKFDIDDELMNNEQTNNERKVAEMKKTSFETAFPPVFDEQTIWHRTDANESNKIENENLKMNFAPALPDLFDQHRKQQEKNASSTESSFEQLCSLKSTDHSAGSTLYPLESSSSSSTIRDEATPHNDVFWQKYPIDLSHNVPKRSSTHVLQRQFSSSSSEDDDDDDENFFLRTDDRKTEHVQSNNMMDVFRRQSSPVNNDQHEKVIDNDDDLTLQDNFSFLIAKGMLKPTSF